MNCRPRGSGVGAEDSRLGPGNCTGGGEMPWFIVGNCRHRQKVWQIIARGHLVLLLVSLNNKKFEALGYANDDAIKCTTSYTAPDGTNITKTRLMHEWHLPAVYATPYVCQTLYVPRCTCATPYICHTVYVPY